MHVADGILRPELCVVAGIATAGALLATSRHATTDEVPRMGLLAATLFAVSLIHFPLGGASLHLGLAGLAGVLLGWRSVPVVFSALLFQAVLFQHGGLLTLGINTINIGSGAIAAWYIWRPHALPESLRAFLAGFAGVAAPATLIALELHVSDYGSGVFWVLPIYGVSALIEGALTVAIVAFFRRSGARILDRP
ncbi:MAG: cobalt transporter CbiM [Acidobacteria bacterium]|nr:cobalt transporter CbiM [Acidobacteriota bacterium]